MTDAGATALAALWSAWSPLGGGRLFAPLRRPKTPTLFWVIEGADGITRIPFANNEPLFAVRRVFVGLPDDTASVACLLDGHYCRWTGPVRPGDSFVAVAGDTILCSTPSSPPVYLTALWQAATAPWLSNEPLQPTKPPKGAGRRACIITAARADGRWS
jgi:hypothetical protein